MSSHLVISDIWPTTCQIGHAFLCCASVYIACVTEQCKESRSFY